MPTTQEQFWFHYNNAPKDIQETIAAAETADAIRKTAEGEGVLLEVSVLAEITGDVMLGILPITKFRETIQEGLGVDEEKARRIAQAIRDKVFVGIADTLRIIHNLQ